MTRRIVPLLILALTTVFIVIATLALPLGEARCAVIVSDEGDPMRAAAFLNGATLAAEERGGISLQVYRESSNVMAQRMLRLLVSEGRHSILTNIALADVTITPSIAVFTTEANHTGGLCMTPSDDDELNALAAYVRACNFSRGILLLPASYVQGAELQTLFSDTQTVVLPYMPDTTQMETLVDLIITDTPDFVLVWGDESQVPRLISNLRHGGYSGSVLAPSFLANYEALGVNAGQAVGICFAAQYINPKRGAHPVNRSQQQFLIRYAARFGEEALFAEAYYGYDQVLLLKAYLSATDAPSTAGIAQHYDFSSNPATGITALRIFTIQPGRIDEAR